MKHFANINLHLTDYCNQNCPFCFAREEMTSTTKKELDYDTYRMLVGKLKKEGVVMVNLIGGEPTLNSRFSEILKYSYKNFVFIRIYTNGVFSEKVRRSLLQSASRLYLVVNISTPGFYLNKKIREHVLKNMSLLCDHIEITLSVVSSFMNTETINVLSLINPDLLKKVRVKLSFLAQTAGDHNIMKISDFPKVGENVCKTIEFMEKYGPPKQIRSNAMFRPCMFSSDQRQFLKKRGLDFFTEHTDCHVEDEISSCEFHVTSDMRTFKCYPLSTIDYFNFSKKTTFNEIKEKYDFLQQKYKEQYVLSYCRKCPFFGFEKGKCTGPCMGFRMNAYNEEQKKKESGNNTQKLIA